MFVFCPTEIKIKQNSSLKTTSLFYIVSYKLEKCKEFKYKTQF